MPLQKQRHFILLTPDILSFRQKNKQHRMSTCQITVTMSETDSNMYFIQLLLEFIHKSNTQNFFELYQRFI